MYHYDVNCATLVFPQFIKTLSIFGNHYISSLMDSNQLDFFEELITVAASTGSSPTFEKMRNFVRLSTVQIQEEKNKILRVFRNLKFQLLDEKQIEWVINAYHERLVHLFNELTLIVDYSNDEINSNNKLSFIHKDVLLQ